MAIFISNVLLNTAETNILIEGNRIAGIGATLAAPDGATIIDGSHMAAFPTFANLHTHAAMTLLRSYGDDKPLQEWLTQWIWPKEKELDSERIYWGVRLACIEMIKSGTTAFNDMYFFLADAARAVEDSGIRALLGDAQFGDCEAFDDPHTYQQPAWVSERVRYTVAPHAIYTVSDKGLLRTAKYCKANGLKYHIHTSETEKEVADCIKEHGCRPIEHLEKIGILDIVGEDFVGAHSLHIDDHEAAILGRHHGTVVHNPNSNLKLGSGHAFRYCELHDAGVHVTLGTDGCSSSNNLDMLEACKLMALLQKGWRREPTVLPADEALAVASRNGFDALGIDAGEISVGRLADLMLCDLNNVAFIPNNDTTANLVYAAHSECIDTVVCDGRIVMRGRKVEGEDEVREMMNGRCRMCR